MKKNLSLFGLLSLLSLSPAFGGDTPPYEAYISKVKYSGSGCPKNSLAVALTPDRQTISVLFQDFVVESEGVRRRHRSDKEECTIDLTLVHPKGWQFSVITADYRGFADLEPGTWGRQTSTYKFLGEGRALKPSQTQIKGPFTGDYFRRDGEGVQIRGYSKCDNKATLRIHTTMQVGGVKGTQAVMALDSIDGALGQLYRFSWRRCK